MASAVSTCSDFSAGLSRPAVPSAASRFSASREPPALGTQKLRSWRVRHLLASVVEFRPGSRQGRAPGKESIDLSSEDCKFDVLLSNLEFGRKGRR